MTQRDQSIFQFIIMYVVLTIIIIVSGQGLLFSLIVSLVFAMLLFSIAQCFLVGVLAGKKNLGGTDQECVGGIDELVVANALLDYKEEITSETYVSRKEFEQIKNEMGRLKKMYSTNYTGFVELAAKYGNENSEAIRKYRI